MAKTKTCRVVTNIPEKLPVIQAEIDLLQTYWAAILDVIAANDNDPDWGETKTWRSVPPFTYVYRPKNRPNAISPFPTNGDRYGTLRTGPRRSKSS